MFYKEREWHPKEGEEKDISNPCLFELMCSRECCKRISTTKIKSTLFYVFSSSKNTSNFRTFHHHTTLLPSSPILKIGFSIFYHFSNGIYTCRIFLLYLFFFFEKKPVSRDHSHLQRNFFSLSHYLHERGSTKHPFFLNL